MTVKALRLAAPPVANPELVQLLEQLLADARTGQLSALYGVAEYHSGHADHLTCGEVCEFTMAGHLLALANWTVGEDE